MHEQEPARKTSVGIYILIGCGVLAAAFVVLSILAGFLVPTLLRGRMEADKVKCRSNLRMIATSSIGYADEFGGRIFPFSPEGGIASLQLLVDKFPELSPMMFICPSAKGQATAPVDPQGKFRLTPETCSYEMVPVKLRPTDQGILAYDSAPYHNGGRNVVYADASVAFLSEAKFQEELAKALAKAAAADDRGASGKK